MKLRTWVYWRDNLAALCMSINQEDIVCCIAAVRAKRLLEPIFFIQIL